MPKPSKLVLHTYTGRAVDPFCMQPSDVCLEDIAHALSLLARWGGHTDVLLSVAEHSILVAWRVWVATGNLEATRCALLHDATEAYVQDLISPIKSRLRSYRTLEQKVAKAISKRFNLGAMKKHHKAIKFQDLSIREKERSEDNTHYRLTAQIAERNFLRLYRFIEHAQIHGASKLFIAQAFLANI